MSWWVGVIAEAFHCPPSVAEHEWLTAPAGWIEQILEARNFAACKDILDRAKTKADVPDSPMMRTVKQIVARCAKEDIARERTGG